MSRRVTLVALAAATALITAACSEESGGTASDTTTTTTDETTTTESSEPADDAPATGETGNIEYTAPGTELRIGDKAVVPFTSGGEQGAIGITVTAVERGDPADIASLGADAAGQVPYFVRFTVTNESGAPFSYITPPSVNGILDDGRNSGGVYGGGVDKCEMGESGDDIGTAGAGFESCRIALSTGTTAVAGAEYDDDASDIEPGANYQESPITWR